MGVTYKPRVSLSIPELEDCEGVIQDLNDRGALLLSTERFAIGTTFEMWITLMLGKNKMPCNVPGKIEKFEKNVQKLLNGYRISFSADIPASTKNMLRDAVSEEAAEKSKAAVVAPAEKKAPASETAPSPKPKYEQQKFIPQRQTAPKEPAQSWIDAASSKKKETPRPGQSAKFLLITLVVAAAFAGSVSLYGLWSRKDLAGKFPPNLGVQGIEDVYGTLYLEVRPDWISTGTAEEREADLDELAFVLSEKGLPGARLVTKEGKLLARVILGSAGSAADARIQIYD